MTLAQRSVRSAGYTVVSSGIQAAVQFARSIILARLLLPQQFGVYAYAASFVMLTYSLPGFGMGAALVHRARQSEGENARRVHFTLVTAFNLAWALLLTATCTWFVEPQNRWVFWLILATRVADNLTSTARVTLTRRVAFRRVALLESGNALIGSLAAVLLAWRGAGLWSLVATDIIAAVIGILGFYVIRPVWRPRFGWDREVAAYMLDFGKRSFGAILLLRILDRMDDLWTGAFLGKAPLGYYSRAYTFATYPRKLLANPVNQVAVGTYAALKGQPKRLSQAFFRVNALLIRSGFFMAGLLFLLVPEFIHFVIGDKWLPMLTPFRLMLVYTLLDPIKATIGSVFVAIGLPEVVTRIRMWQAGVMLAGLFTLGPLWGISGVALAVDVMLFFGIALLLREVRPYIQFSSRALFGVPVLALGAGLAVAAAWQALSDAALAWQTAAWKGTVFSLVYAGILLALERSDLRSMLDIVFSRAQETPPARTGPSP